MTLNYYYGPSQISSTQPKPKPQSSSTTTSNTSSESSPLHMTEINARHYQSLLQDNVDDLDDQVGDGDDLSELTRSSDKSSILHIAASTCQNERMINFIVEQCPTLLTLPNAKGDLPLHFAVRAGHLSVVHNLVHLANQVDNCSAGSMLEHDNCENNTALHIALENQQKGMAEFLFGICPGIINQRNSLEISPLFLAIKAGFWDLVEKMVECGADLDSKISKDDQVLKHPVIHAIIMAKNEGILKKFIERHPDELIHSIDEKGRRPLSYAAFIGFLDGVNCIINMKDKYNEANTLYRNQAFKADLDGSFPIHVACCGGHIRVVKELLFSLPEKMRWLVNQKGQSILHVAAQCGKAEVVEYLLRQPKLVTMINMKDEDGHTPLHLGTLGKHPRVVCYLTWNFRTKLNLQSKNGLTALDLAENYGDVPSFDERLTWLALIYAGAPRSPQGLNEQDVAHIPNGLVLNGKTTFVVTDQGQLQAINHPRKRKNKYKERINTLLVISTLIATVTFASAFTVPGGYNNSDPKVGMATLDHKCAFQLFVISNSIALYTSILAMITLIWAHLDDLRLTLVSLDVALPLLGTALGTMSVAFMAGVYVVLHDVCWLRILVLVMGGVFLVVLVVFFIPLYSPRTCIKYRLMRYVTRLPFKLMLLACEKGKCHALY